MGILLSFLLFFGFKGNPEPASMHPVYVSVLEINNNKAENLLEISYKLDTEDLETQLKRSFKTKVDLYNKDVHEQSEKLISEYLQKHLSISVNGKQQELKLLGFELISHHTFVYYEIENKEKVNELTVVNDVLYEFSKEQIHIIQYKQGGKTYSRKMLNPVKKVVIKPGK